MDNNVLRPDLTLTNLYKSNISDAEFEVARLRSTYPNKIEQLHRSVIRENVQVVKNNFQSFSFPLEEISDNKSNLSFKQECEALWNQIRGIQSQLKVHKI